MTPNRRHRSSRTRRNENQRRRKPSLVKILFNCHILLCSLMAGAKIQTERTMAALSEIGVKRGISNGGTPSKAATFCIR